MPSRFSRSGIPITSRHHAACKECDFVVIAAETPSKLLLYDVARGFILLFSVQLVSLENAPPEVRQAAAVSFKNHVKFHWAAREDHGLGGSRPKSIPDPEKVGPCALKSCRTHNQLTACYFPRESVLPEQGALAGGRRLL
jgi:Importin-beta N-terminal domain